MLPPMSWHQGSISLNLIATQQRLETSDEVHVQFGFELDFEEVKKMKESFVVIEEYPDNHYQAPKPHKTYASSSKHTPSTRCHAPTRNKGKEIAKLITPPSESASEEEDIDPEQAQRDKDMQKNLALIAKYIKNIYIPTNNNLITSSNTRNKNVDTSPRTRNNSQAGKFMNQRTITIIGARETVGNQEKDYAYHNEKMMLCKQEEKGMPISAEQDEWLHDTDEEPDKQELEAHYMYMEKIQEVLTADSGPTYDAEPLEHV
ncbi:hypothetical protein Tco_0084982 [Tanacetum coccineum]